MNFLKSELTKLTNSCDSFKLFPSQNLLIKIEKFIDNLSIPHDHARIESEQTKSKKSINLNLKNSGNFLRNTDIKMKNSKLDTCDKLIQIEKKGNLKSENFTLDPSSHKFQNSFRSVGSIKYDLKKYSTRNKELLNSKKGFINTFEEVYSSRKSNPKMFNSKNFALLALREHLNQNKIQLKELFSKRLFKNITKGNKLTSNISPINSFNKTKFKKEASRQSSENINYKNPFSISSMINEIHLINSNKSLKNTLTEKEMSMLEIKKINKKSVESNLKNIKNLEDLKLNFISSLSIFNNMDQNISKFNDISIQNEEN